MRIPYIPVGPFKTGIKIWEDVTSEKLKLLVLEHYISADIKDGWVSFTVMIVTDHEVVVIT